MATSSYLNRQTPGVYITEIDAFGNAIVGVQTAVPIFIGYTQYAGDPATGAPLYNTPVAISSMAEFTSYFGGAAPQLFTVEQVPPAPTTGAGTQAVQQTPDFVANYVPLTNGSTVPVPSGSAAPGTMPQGFLLNPDASEAQFNLYWSMLLFYANGGGNCYVVSCGSYWTTTNQPTGPVDPVAAGFTPGAIELGALDGSQAGLLAGLGAAAYANGPTMIVIPEAILFSGDAPDYDNYGKVIQAMMQQAAQLQDRVAILDLPGVLTAKTITALETCQSTLWAQTAPQIANASYAAAYAPALNTSVVTTSNVDFTWLNQNDDNNTLLNNILTAQAVAAYSGSTLESIQQAIAKAFPVSGKGNGESVSADSSQYPAQQQNQSTAQYNSALDNLLQNSLPIYKTIATAMAGKMNVMAPAAAMAGVWTKSDNMSGVWNAPANIALASVDGPLYNMSDVEQGTFNVPTNGQAIDVIRAQINRGTVVWGARTLDGNSLDYRYIQVRRTLIYVEQSIKLALQSYVFAPNDATTWSTVSASVSSFLTGLWQQGGLMGSKASDAFSVSVGLGSTMTSQDILNGYMIVAITLQMIHPAEFIELTFTQTMGS